MPPISSMQVGQIGDAGAAIISIKPRFAEAIFTGQKSVELRRKIPAISPGIRLYVYSTLPVGAIIGSATVERVERSSPEDIWLKLGDRAAIKRPDFDAYFRGTTEAVALILTDCTRALPLTIKSLRDVLPRFHPPQVLTRLSEEDLGLLQPLMKTPVQ